MEPIDARPHGKPPVHLALANKTFFELVFGQDPNAISDNQLNRDGVSDCDKVRIDLLGKLNEICFTNGVNAMRQPQFIPSPRINASAQALFDAAGVAIEVALMDKPGNLRFWRESGVAMVLLPANFYVQCFMEPVHVMESLAFVASMVKDHLAGKTKPPRNVRLRAIAHNAEILKSLSEINPTLTLDEVQVKIVEALPFGFESCPDGLFYD